VLLYKIQIDSPPIFELFAFISIGEMHPKFPSEKLLITAKRYKKKKSFKENKKF